MNDATLLQTARNLRKSVGLTAIALPVALLLLAGPQDSISAFYWTDSGRDALVGALALVSGFLMAYAATDWRSRYAARVAAVSAACVAWFPTAPVNPTTTDQVMGAIHGTAALIFFGALAYHCYQLFPVGASKAMARFYRGCAFVIVAAIVISAWGIVVGAPGRYVLVMETLAIWAFGAAWWLVAKAGTIQP